MELDVHLFIDLSRLVYQQDLHKSKTSLAQIHDQLELNEDE